MAPWEADGRTTSTVNAMDEKTAGRRSAHRPLRTDRVRFEKRFQNGPRYENNKILNN